jgi:hypothetical protein
MKGQYLTLENVFFFAVGVALVIAVYAVFSAMSENMRSAVLQDQLAKEGEGIRASVAKVFAAGNSTNSTIRLSLSIPRQLSGCDYKITVGGGGIRLNCLNGQGSSGSLNLYGIDTTINIGAVYSNAEKINILYSNGKILLS